MAAAEAIFARVRGTTDLKSAAEGADLVIEAVIEIMDLKKTVYKELEGFCAPETIFASNTSGLSITEMASATKRAGSFLGMHFFNPVPVMKLVELIRGFSTSDETYELCKAFVEASRQDPRRDKRGAPASR